MNNLSATASRDLKTVRAFLEVIQRNIKQAIWKYEFFPTKEETGYKQFVPARVDRVRNIAMMWTGGKDSTIVLYCIA